MSDPSGHFFQLIAIAVAVVAKVGGLTAIAAAVLAAVVTAGVTFAMTGSLEAALIQGALAFASAYGAHKIGSFFDNQGLSFFQETIGRGADVFNAMARASAHGLYNGGLTELAGGEFKHGFTSGFTGSIAGSLMATEGATGFFGEAGDLSDGRFIMRTTAAAVVGGTTSELAGGKFANGATTAAFVHLFNSEGQALSGTHSDEELKWGEWTTETDPLTGEEYRVRNSENIKRTLSFKRQVSKSKGHGRSN
jgi:hypothetical protein